MFKTASELAEQLGSKLAQKLSQEGNIGFAAGKTMDPLYAALRINCPRIIKAHAWMLDEYLGLSDGHPQTFGFYLDKEVFNPLDYPNELIHRFPINLFSAEQAARNYEESLQRAGSLELQLLGIGLNGHVGLNEPGSSQNSITRVVAVAQATREANQSSFSSLSEVPHSAITMGIKTISQSKEIWLIATGEKKAMIVKKLVENNPSEQLPASLLKNHQGFKLFLDEAAAELITKPVC